MLRHKLNVFFFLLAAIFVTAFFWTSEYLVNYLLIVFLVFFCILSAGVLFLRFNYFMDSICKTNKPFVLLTFDDGPDPVLTPKILDTLAKHDVKALFFVIGKKAENHSDLIDRMVREGHFIGNHTYSHPPIFALMNGTNVKTQLQKFDAILAKNQLKTPLFRPPVGYTNPIIARVVKHLNLKVIGWDKRSYDTVITNPIWLANRLNRQAKLGSILLMHDNLKQTEAALPLFLESAKKKGTIFANEQDIKTLLNEII